MLNLQLIHHHASLKSWLPGVQLHNTRWKSATRSRGRWRRGYERWHCLGKVLLLHQGAGQPPRAPDASPVPGSWPRPPGPLLHPPPQCTHAHMHLADKCISHAYVYTPCTLTCTSCTLTSHTHISQAHTNTHILHICFQPPSWCGIRLFFNTTRRKTWQWNEGPLPPAELLFVMSGDSAVRQRKLSNVF